MLFLSLADVIWIFFKACDVSKNGRKISENDCELIHHIEYRSEATTKSNDCKKMREFVYFIFFSNYWSKNVWNDEKAMMMGWTKYTNINTEIRARANSIS